MGATVWLQRLVDEARRSRRYAAYSDRVALTLHDPYSTLADAAAAVGDSGVLLLDRPPDNDWAAALKRLRDSDPVAARVTVAVVMNGVEDARAVRGQLAGRRGPGPTDAVMLPRRFIDMVASAAEEVHGAIVTAVEREGSDVERLAMLLQPNSGRLRVLWDRWCREGSLPAALAGHPDAGAAAAAAATLDDDHPAEALAALDAVALDPAVSLRQVRQRTRRSGRWMLDVDKRAVERMVWAQAGNASNEMATRRRLLLDPAYASSAPSEQAATWVGIARALWRMQAAGDSDLVTGHGLRWRRLATRDALEVGDLVIDVSSAARPDGRSLRPLAAVRAEGKQALQASSGGLLNTRLSVSVVPAWVVAIAAELAPSVLAAGRRGQAHSQLR
ncbi:MAG TPA: hypothetical protein VMD59_21620 [Acidimicrobiales bacterium]|nr:hypothetical protein [Acidimicrobiales bacterium]